MSSDHAEIRDAVAADSLFVLSVRNDRDAAASSRNPGVINEDEHTAWFVAALANPSRDIFIVTCAGDDSGYVRLDHEPDGVTAEVSIALLPSRRGQGLSKAALALALSRWGERGGRSAVAWVKVGNEPSARLFSSAGFVADTQSGDWLKFTKVLGVGDE